MDDRSRVLMAACAGAAAGAVWGWLYLTDRGRRVRDQIGPTIDGVIDELSKVRETAEKARTAVHEGSRLLTDITVSLRESA